MKNQSGREAVESSIKERYERVDGLLSEHSQRNLLEAPKAKRYQLGKDAGGSNGYRVRLTNG